MREISFKKLLTVHFVGVVSFIIFNYYILVGEFMHFLNPHPYSTTTKTIIMIIFHIFFFMLVWSMIQSIISDPGRVPIYWGFLAETNNNNQRRYCLLCHCFKPERCHHCSTCQRCVLNMDHHCPWISNCVGYTNRKFFILFLVYVILALIIMMFIQIPLAVIELKGLGTIFKFNFHTVLRCVGLLLQIGFLIVIITFFKFHLQLMMTNSTTLDNLQRQRNPSAGPNVFNVGSYDNFTQVFGSDPIMWPFPFYGQSRPNGDGMQWRKQKN